jgi:hypothetical protein
VRAPHSHLGALTHTDGGIMRGTPPPADKLGKSCGKYAGNAVRMPD